MHIWMNLSRCRMGAGSNEPSIRRESRFPTERGNVGGGQIQCKAVINLCCSVRSKIYHSVFENGMRRDAAFYQNYLTICYYYLLLYFFLFLLPLIIIITGPPAHSVGATLVTVADVCRRL